MVKICRQYHTCGAIHKLSLMAAELEHVSEWAQANNLKRNIGKSKELIIFQKGAVPKYPAEIPGACEGAVRQTAGYQH